MAAGGPPARERGKSGWGCRPPSPTADVAGVALAPPAPGRPPRRRRQDSRAACTGPACHRPPLSTSEGEQGGVRETGPPLQRPALRRPALGAASGAASGCPCLAACQTTCERERGRGREREMRENRGRMRVGFLKGVIVGGGRVEKNGEEGKEKKRKRN